MPPPDILPPLSQGGRLFQGVLFRVETTFCAAGGENADCPFMVEIVFKKKIEGVQ